MWSPTQRCRSILLLCSQQMVRDRGRDRQRERERERQRIKSDSPKTIFLIFDSWWMTDVYHFHFLLLQKLLLIGLSEMLMKMTLAWFGGGQTMISASHWYPVLIPNFSTSFSASSSSSCSCRFTAVTPFSSFLRRPLSFSVLSIANGERVLKFFRADRRTEGRTGLDPQPVSPRADQKEKMGQASVGLFLITQECLNKAASAGMARLLLLFKLLHLLSPPTHLLRNKDYYLWPFTLLKNIYFSCDCLIFLLVARRGFKSSAQKDFKKLPKHLYPAVLFSLRNVIFFILTGKTLSDFSHVGVFGVLVKVWCWFGQIQQDVEQNVLQMKLYCFCHFHMLMIDLLGGGQTQSFVLASVMNCKVNRLQAIMQLPRSSLCSEAVNNVPTHTGTPFTLQPPPAHAAANICPKPQRSTTKCPRSQSVSRGWEAKTWASFWVTQIIASQSKKLFSFNIVEIVWVEMETSQILHLWTCLSISLGFLSSPS